ncbi:MAG: hypothetical protein ACRDTC_09245 [Pseudonocardiaceae bacterium]
MSRPSWEHYWNINSADLLDSGTGSLPEHPHRAQPGHPMAAVRTPEGQVRYRQKVVFLTILATTLCRVMAGDRSSEPLLAGLDDIGAAMVTTTPGAPHRRARPAAVTVRYGADVRAGHSDREIVQVQGLVPS